MKTLSAFLLAATLGFAQRPAPEQKPLPDLTAEQKATIEAALPRTAPAKPKRARRILISNLNIGHGKHPSITYGNYALAEMGKRTGAYEVVISDDVEMFRPDKIKQFDAICFLNTVGVLTEDPELKRSLMDFIESGKGFIGFHAAAATFVQWPKYDQWPAFGKMLGATENGGHPWRPNENIRMKVDDPKSPLNVALPKEGFDIADEVFQFQEPKLRELFHVLVSIDIEKSGMNPQRKVLPIRREDMDFPMTWIRQQGKGRVYYSSLGHNPSIFYNATLLPHFLAGIQYALGDLKADDRPSAKGK